MNMDHGIPNAIEAAAKFQFADYVEDNPTLLSLYHKAKRNQWDANTDIDWSYELNEDNPLAMPDGTIAIYGSSTWDKMSEKNRADLRNHVQGWNISQILHGEQGALFCASRIAQSEPDMVIKYCNAAQVMDEARHIEVYSRLMSKMKNNYPISGALYKLLEQIMGESRHDFASLGMQILIEGLALTFFKNVQAYSNDPFVKNMQALVLRDEARHFATGQVALSGFYPQLMEHERREREEFVVEACHTLLEHLFGEDIWTPMGIPRSECRELVRASQINQSMQRSVFRHLVPAVSGIGLMGREAIRFFDNIGVMSYAEA